MALRKFLITLLLSACMGCQKNEELPQANQIIDPGTLGSDPSKYVGTYLFYYDYVSTSIGGINTWGDTAVGVIKMYKDSGQGYIYPQFRLYIKYSAYLKTEPLVYNGNQITHPEFINEKPTRDAQGSYQGEFRNDSVFIKWSSSDASYHATSNLVGVKL
ncbi:MAG: hypothetical protein RIC15_00865 [Vicingaceae bacterium]